MPKIPLLQYAIRFMNRLSFIKKFMVVSVLFVFPLLILGGALFKEINQSIKVTAAEREGIQLLYHGYDLLIAAADFRDLQLILRNDSSNQVKRLVNEQATEFESQLSQFEEALTHIEEIEITKQLNILRATWKSVQNTSAGAAGGPNIQFQFYDQLVTAVELLINTITYDRQLIHEPSLKNILLINTLIKEVPESLRSIGKARAYGAYALSLNALDYETHKTLDSIYDAVLEDQLLLEQSLDYAANQQPNDDNIIAASDMFMDGIDQGANYFYENLIEKEFIEGTWQNYHETLSQSVKVMLDATQILLPSIDHDLQQRIEQRTYLLFSLMLITAILSIVIFYLYSAVYFSIQSHINHFARKAHQVAGGDLTVKLEIESNDELSQVYAAFNEMLGQLKDHQNRLLQAEKMASLGGMISGVAHEMNTPMGIVKTAMSQVDESIEHISSKLTDQSMTRSDLETFLADTKDAVFLMSENTERCISLISTFKQLNVYQERDNKVVVDLCDLLDSIPKLFMREDHPQIIKIIRPSTLTSKVDKELLLLVLGNLVSNAYEHAFESASSENSQGTITIEGIEAEDHIKIIVSDDGKGFDEESIVKAFEPFFTTKRNQGCIGLGLHIVFIIVTQALDGIIEIESEPDTGTRVCMQFPKGDVTHPAIA